MIFITNDSHRINTDTSTVLGSIYSVISLNKYLRI
uniref:HieA n=1 Tax=Nostoc sp. (strain PCC 9229) TaxID=70817 RepID=Q9F6K1_NOSS9|nr:HieA [Nostoc sp. PCC 9229]